MKFSKETETRIIGALLPKLANGRIGLCGVCEHRSWRLLNAFVAIAASKEMEGYPIDAPNTPLTQASQDRILPFAALGCTICGNTHFLNLRVLGLDDLIIPPSAMTEAPEVPKLEE